MQHLCLFTTELAISSSMAVLVILDSSAHVEMIYSDEVCNVCNAPALMFCELS